MNTKHKLELNFKSAVGFFYFFSSTNVEPKKVCPIAYNMKIGYLMAGGRYILTMNCSGDLRKRKGLVFSHYRQSKLKK